MPMLKSVFVLVCCRFLLCLSKLPNPVRSQISTNRRDEFCVVARLVRHVSTMACCSPQPQIRRSNEACVQTRSTRLFGMCATARALRFLSAVCGREFTTMGRAIEEGDKPYQVRCDASNSLKIIGHHTQKHVRPLCYLCATRSSVPHSSIRACVVSRRLQVRTGALPLCAHSGVYVRAYLCEESISRPLTHTWNQRTTERLRACSRLIRETFHFIARELRSTNALTRKLSSRLECVSECSPQIRTESTATYEQQHKQKTSYTHRASLVSCRFCRRHQHTIIINASLRV